jgi:DNA primase
MNFDAISFLEEFGIRYWTEGKNTQEGWVNITCPFCSDSTNHGGFNIKKGYYNCWHCGHHFLDKVIQSLTGLDFIESKRTLEKYLKAALIRNNLNKKKKEIEVNKVEFPTGSKELREIHRKYLEKRNFDPFFIMDEYNILGTGHLGNYKFKIIAPIYFEGRMVSYQGRDITGKLEVKYKACRKDLEIIHHKDILYNIDRAKKDSVVICEGITDVWRLGENSVATFGIKYTQNQLLLLAKRFKRAFILFDSEVDAQRRAENLARALSGFGLEVENIELEKGDPADLKQDDADKLMVDLIGA